MVVNMKHEHFNQLFVLFSKKKIKEIIFMILTFNSLFIAADVATAANCLSLLFLLPWKPAGETHHIEKINREKLVVQDDYFLDYLIKLCALQQRGI